MALRGTCIDTNTCTYVHVCTRILMYIRKDMSYTYLCTYIRVYRHESIYMHVYMSRYRYLRARVCIHMCTYICKRTNIHIYI